MGRLEGGTYFFQFFFANDFSFTFFVHDIGDVNNNTPGERAREVDGGGGGLCLNSDFVFSHYCLIHLEKRETFSAFLQHPFFSSKFHKTRTTAYTRNLRHISLHMYLNFMSNFID